MVKSISNHNEKYLHPSVFNEIFSEANRGTIKYFDKVKTGIGGTTSFHKIQPPQDKINIIISANRGMILDKGQSNTDARVVFICTDSKDTSPRDNTRLVYITPESLKALWQSHFSHLKVDKVLADEFHSIVIQSELRKELRLYRKKLKSMFPDSIIVLMTATPILSQEVDYRLTDVDMPKQTWYINNNAPMLIEDIKANVSKKKLTNIFTNSSSFLLSFKEVERKTIDKVKKIRNYLNMDLKVGASMALNIYRKAIVSSSDVLMGISSTGFEGWDDNREGVNNYFIQNLNNDYEMFGIENIYQSLSRTRLGAHSTTVCRVDKSNDLINTKKLIESIQKRNPEAKDFVSKKKIQNKFKVSNKEYQRINLLYSTTHTDGKLTLDFDEDLYNYYLGLYDYITEGFSNDKVKEFLNIRNISLNYIETVQKGVGHTRVNFDSEREYLESNAHRIEEGNLCSDDIDIKTHGIKIKDLNKVVYKQLKRRLIIENICEKSISGSNTRLIKAISFFEVDGEYSEVAISKVIDNLKKQYKRERANKTRAHRNKAEKKGKMQGKTNYILSNFEYKFYSILNNTLNYNRTDKGTRVMHRIYGPHTELSKTMIYAINSLFNISAFEVDIKSCATRILYAIMGLKVPNDLYGDKKQYKVLINKNLNQVYNKKPSKSKRDLSNFNIDPNVVEGLIKRFHGKDSNLFYLFYTEYEEQIIDQLDKEFKKELGSVESIRRHDSRIFYGNYNIRAINNVLSKFTFLGFDGWFDLLEEPIEEEFLRDIFNETKEEIIIKEDTSTKMDLFNQLIKDEDHELYNFVRYGNDEVLKYTKAVNYTFNEISIPEDEKTVFD